MASNYLANKILRVLPSRVWRTYFGGLEIEKWQGKENPCDGEFPEVWIASMVRARNPGRENIIDEGLSKVAQENGNDSNLIDIVSSDPQGFLGSEHSKKHSCNPGMLVKIIDSLNRLTIQVHPDKEFAERVFSSQYGKTEAWYIIGGRKVKGEEPYVLLGFKPGMAKEKWKRLFEAQDIEEMLNSLHKVYVKPGDVYFIEGGVPHAIGPGCFLVEIQEPTDYTIRVERRTPEGKQIPDVLCHQGAGFDESLNCFHYNTYSLEETLNRWKISSQTLYTGPDAVESLLIGEDQTKLFRMYRYKVMKSYRISASESFFLVIIMSGQGELKYGENDMLDVKQGDLLFIPAQVGEIECKARQQTGLEIITCHPAKYS